MQLCYNCTVLNAIMSELHCVEVELRKNTLSLSQSESSNIYSFAIMCIITFCNILSIKESKYNELKVVYLRFLACCHHGVHVFETARKALFHVLDQPRTEKRTGNRLFNACVLPKTNSNAVLDVSVIICLSSLLFFRRRSEIGDLELFETFFGSCIAYIDHSIF